MANLIQDIDVTAFYFNRQRCFPRRVEIDGQPVAFLESGLRRLVNQGQQAIEIFNMTDGFEQYDLAHDIAGNRWKLLKTQRLA